MRAVGDTPGHASLRGVHERLRQSKALGGACFDTARCFVTHQVKLHVIKVFALRQIRVVLRGEQPPPQPPYYPLQEAVLCVEQQPCGDTQVEIQVSKCGRLTKRFERVMAAFFPSSQESKTRLSETGGAEPAGTRLRSPTPRRQVRSCSIRDLQRHGWRGWVWL